MVVVGMGVGVLVSCAVGLAAVRVDMVVRLGVGEGMGEETEGVNSEESMLGLIVITLDLGISSISGLGVI